MLKAAGYPKGVSFSLIIPSGDATYARAAALLQQELATSGFTANLQQIPGADFLTDVYIKKQGDALLSEELTQRSRSDERLRGSLRALGLPGQRLRFGQPATHAADRAGQRVIEPQPAGPAHAADRQDGHSTGPAGPAGLHAVDRRVQQEPGRGDMWSPRSGSAAPTWPASTSRSSGRRGPHEDRPRRDGVPPSRISLS